MPRGKRPHSVARLDPMDEPLDGRTLVLRGFQPVGVFTYTILRRGLDHTAAELAEARGKLGGPANRPLVSGDLTTSTTRPIPPAVTQVNNDA